MRRNNFTKWGRKDNSKTVKQVDKGFSNYLKEEIMMKFMLNCQIYKSYFQSSHKFVNGILP